MLSVALSRSLRTVGVTHHRVLGSPDFPLPGCPGSDRPADSQTTPLYPFTLAHRQELHAKIAVVIQPRLVDLETGGARKMTQFGKGILVRVFGANGFTFRKT